MAGKYPPDVWGDDPCPAQHLYGTKLMTYFDDDPSKPTRIEAQVPERMAVGKSTRFMWSGSRARPN